MPEGDPNNPPALDLDALDDDKLTERLKRLPAFADLFADPPAPKAPPRPSRGGGRRRPQDEEDAMASLVSAATSGLGKGFAEAIMGRDGTPAPGPAKAAPTPTPTQEPPKRRHFFFGEL